MNITWKHLFSNTILKRGETYFQNGNVRTGTNTSANVQTFFVSGTDLYIVKITRGKDSIKTMQCDCPYAMGGARCKHMAAALFQMEKNGDLEIDSSRDNAAVKAKILHKPTTVLPFKQEKRNANEEAPYQYYKFDRITKNYIFYSDDFETAKKLIESKSIILREVYEGFPEYIYRPTERECIVTGVYIDSRKNEHIVKMTFSRDEMLFHLLLGTNLSGRTTAILVLRYEHEQQDVCAFNGIASLSTRLCYKKTTG